MDCSGAGTGENNNIPLSFFFLAKLVTEQSGKLYCGHLKWSAALRSVFWKGTCWQYSGWFGREYFADIALLNDLLDFSSQLWYAQTLSRTCHRGCCGKMHDLIVCVRATSFSGSGPPGRYVYTYVYLESFLFTFWRHCASFLICLWECHSRNARGADLVPPVLSSHNTLFEVTQNVPLIIFSWLLNCQYIQACTVSRSHSPLSGTCRSCHSHIHLYHDPPKRKLCPLRAAFLLPFKQSLSFFCCEHQLQEWNVSGALV